MSSRTITIAIAALSATAAGTASAQQTTYDYMSGPIDSVQPQCSGTCGPQIGDFITGFVTLPDPLPENGTVTVQSLVAGFGIDGSTAFDVGLGRDSEPLDSFTFTTKDGGITQFSFSAAASDSGPSSFDGIQGASGSDTSIRALASGGGWSAAASAGNWTGGLAATPAPEIDRGGAPAALTLFGAIVAMLCGRRRLATETGTGPAYRGCPQASTRQHHNSIE